MEFGRGLLTCSLSLTKEINIANTHLEPWLRNRELRMGQLELEHKLLKSLEMPSMLVGDFNLHSPESDNIDRTYFIELWEALKDPTEENYTWLGPPDGDPIYSKLDFTLLSKEGVYKPVFIS